jgi:hypothetical protein
MTDIWDLEKRIKRIEDVTGITEERERERRAELFRHKRKLVLLRREAKKAGVTIQQYWESQTYATYVASLPKSIVDSYEKERT